jgi:polysaccharide biosynthesis protein PslG
MTPATRVGMVAATALAVLLAMPREVESRRPRLGRTIGVNTHYGGPREPLDAAALARLRAAGVALVRNDLDWAAVERTPGVYDFTGSGIDAVVAAAETAGLRVLFILDYGNPIHGPAQAVVDEAGRQAFAAFAAAAATRYGGRGHLWEIWNEPNLPQFWNGAASGPDPLAYAALVAAVLPALRAADPSGAVLIGSVFMGLPALVRALGGIPGSEFLDAVFAAGLLAVVDGVSVHLYRAEPPESAAAEVHAVRESMERAGRVVPLWSGEWGYSTYDPAARPSGVNYLPAVTPARQASYVARMLLHNHLLGLAGSIVFKDRDAAPADPGNIEHHFGLLEGDLSPKPAYVAIATLVRLLGTARMQRTLPLGRGEHGVVFRGPGGRRVVALWGTTAAVFRLRAKQNGARVLARDGSDVTPTGLDRGAVVALAPDDGPIYLLGRIRLLSAASGVLARTAARRSRWH